MYVLLFCIYFIYFELMLSDNCIRLQIEYQVSLTGVNNRYDLEMNYPFLFLDF